MSKKLKKNMAKMTNEELFKYIQGFLEAVRSEVKERELKLEDFYKEYSDMLSEVNIET